MDLISTLTTSYILDQYVKGQTDRQKTLDKLPPNVEAETRAKAATAFETTNTTVPAKLTDADVVTTVNGLRQRDSAFNEQMETVKRLLIAAGQSDLGSGRLGTEVNLSSVSGLAIAPDGTLYINAPYDRRVWKLDANGRLVTAAGKGSAGTESLTGKSGPDALLTTLRSVSLDGTGRALIFEDDLSMELDSAPYGARLSWLGTDGKLTEISRAFGWGGFAVPGVGDEAIVVSWLAADEDEGNAQIMAVKPGQAPQVKKVLTDTQSNLISNAEAVGVDAQGGLLFTTYEDGPDDELFSALYRLDPASGAMTKVMTIPDDVYYALDSRGNLFKMTDAGALEVRKADGTNQTLATSAQVPAAIKDGWLDAGALAADGSAYVAVSGKIYRVQNGAFTRVVGTDGTAPVSGKATDLSITPGGVGVFGTTFFVSDTDNHRVLRIGADQQVSTFAGTGRPGDYDNDGTSTDGDGGLATAAKVGDPGILHADAAGNLYIAEYYRIRKVGTDGRISTIFKVDPDDEAYFTDFVVAPDGTVYLSIELDVENPRDPDDTQTNAKILKIAPGATTPRS
ncbi:SMP-30/Gluconolaconase/LRE-like region [compost metagenome]